MVYEVLLDAFERLV